MKNIRVITIICAYLRASLRNLWKTVVFCFILTFLFHASFHGFAVLLAGERTVIVIQSQPIAAYNEAIKGFEEACKRSNVSIAGIYDLKGDIDEGKRVIKNVMAEKLRPGLSPGVGKL